LLCTLLCTRVPSSGVSVWLLARTQAELDIGPFFSPAPMGTVGSFTKWWGTSRRAFLSAEGRLWRMDLEERRSYRLV
jgi:hypothetical protein